ncbi:hypothetical protein SFRURICE_003442 [Spodoptera frugiperda]|nr:hypothetical protein SFRURICE_003442 [Spodoptera frugiperda]
MTSQISCIAHMKFTCELRRIENPNEQQLGSKPARLITSPGRRILLFLGNFTLCSLKSAPSSLSPSPSPITSPLSGNQVAANQHPRPHQGPPYATSKICSLKSHIDYRRANQRMTSQISCIAHMKFTCELRRIENPNEQQLGSKPARHDHLAWSEDPPFLRELYSLFPKTTY